MIQSLYSSLSVQLKKIPDEHHTSVPFFKKDAHEELKQLGFYFETKFMSASDWRWIGVQNAKEFHEMMQASCGMYCLKMILAKEHKKEYPLIQLMKEAQKFGVYKGDMASKGMYHYEFVTFLSRRFGYRGSVFKYLSLKRAKFELSKGNYVLLSVSEEIKEPSLRHKKNVKGGHIILLTGYSNTKGYVQIHNVNGNEGVSDNNFIIREELFKKYYAKRGIAISSENK